jgi:hypothetical protein
MRVHIGAIPSSPDFVPEAPWRPIREPSVRIMQLFALPLGVLMALGVAMLWTTLTPVRNLIPSFSIVSFLALCGRIHHCSRTNSCRRASRFWTIGQNHSGSVAFARSFLRALRRRNHARALYRGVSYAFGSHQLWAFNRMRGISVGIGMAGVCFLGQRVCRVRRCVRNRAGAVSDSTRSHRPQPELADILAPAGAVGFKRANEAD